MTVGDAEGIDYFTMLECHHLGVPHIVYGINGKLRHKTKTCSMNTVCENYLERDRLMVLTADKCIALCYGRSRGTLYTYNYAVKQGKPARLIERF